MSDYLIPPPHKLPPGSVVIAYMRDSGGPNQEESLGQQERVITAYCQQHGLMLLKIYAETASGRKTKKRDQFLAMYESVITASVDQRPRGLLLWSYSRFSRDIIDFNFYFYGLVKNGIAIHSLTEHMPDDLPGQIMLQVKSYANADYSVQLGKQIKRGIHDRVKSGYSNGGTAPRGYVLRREYHDNRRNGSPRIGIKWDVDPELAPLVRLAWQLRAQGKGYAEITRATRGKIYSSKNSWNSHFANKSYLGIGKAGDEEVPDHHEPIITWELWDAVKRVEAAAPRHGASGKMEHPKRVKHPSLLSGLSFCIHCGAAMVMHTSGDYRSYACGTRDRRRVYKECTQARRVNARKADHIILDAVLKRILSPEFFDALLLDIQNQLADTGDLDRRIGELNAQIVHNGRSITRMMKLAEGVGDLEDIVLRLRELNNEKSELDLEVSKLKAERSMQMPQLTPEALAAIFFQWYQQLDSAIQSKDVAVAKKLISQFVKRIDLSHEKAIIHYTYPLSGPAVGAAENNEALRAHLFFGRLPRTLEIEMR